MPENKAGRDPIEDCGGYCGPSSRGDVPDAFGDASFERVVLPHLDAAYNLARWLMRDGEAAEDVLQEAMVRALTYFASFKGVNPRAWLLQIVRNTAYGSMALNRGVETVPIAEATQTPIGTVMSRLWRARQLLAQAAAAEGLP